MNEREQDTLSKPPKKIETARETRGETGALSPTAWRWNVDER